MNNKHAILLGLTLVGCAGANETECAVGDGYIYDSSTDNRAEVFNLKSMTMSTQSKGDADINRSDSEFAGPVVICSNKEYFCISGTLNVSVPRVLGPARWSLNGLSCRMSRDTRSTDLATIECSEDRKPPSIKAEYSGTRGLLSYRRQNVGDDAVFRTRGRCGLFALK
jgi:hypothetical protein